ncbi:MAG TPA: cysteine synthase family protein [Saprospiraceae bacterium]|nr:cysteine synthase family protein [Saprospiraceae bacterium]
MTSSTLKWFKKETYKKIREESIPDFVKPYSARTYPNILETIGDTPLVRLNRIYDDIPGNFYIKLESGNPGSTKDRIAHYMIEQAEKRGDLKPGGTIIEATSGNTGFGLAMVAAVKGYRCVFTTKDKISPEKLSALRALGAEVEVCPSSVPSSDPRSYYARAKQLAKDIPGAYYVNQNFNRDNANAHYYTTGPEIWRQTHGNVTYFVAASGTGGTISGTARYLKEENPDIKVIGVDAKGSILKKYHETGIYDESEVKSYLLEGVGKNIITGNTDFDLIDEFLQVDDRESAYAVREVAHKEGILVGFSTGAVISALKQIKHKFNKKDTVVLLSPDHGNLYFSKIFNDEWMKEKGLM